MSFIYFVIGLAPILWLAFALMVLKMPTYKAACGSLIASILLAILFWHFPIIATATAALEGFLMALCQLS